MGIRSIATKRLLVAAAGLTVAACGASPGDSLDPNATYTAFGHPFEPAAAVPIQAVLAEPEIYAGDAVMIEGLVDECLDAACWMRMTSGDTAEVRILTPEFAVPDTVAGRRIVVHGRLSAADSASVDTTTLGPSTLDLRPTGLMVEKVR